MTLVFHPMFNFMIAWRTYFYKGSTQMEMMEKLFNNYLSKDSLPVFKIEENTW